MAQNSPVKKSSPRKRWIQFHAYLSVFFFPFAIAYTLTGALYIWGDLPTLDKTNLTLYDLEPKSPATLEKVEALIREQCEKNQWPLPSGEIRKDGKEFKWGSTKTRQVKYKASRSTQGKAYLTYLKVTLYGRVLNFHKGKGGKFLDVLGTAFALLLLVSYLSGVYLAFKSSELRNNTVIAFILGFVVLTLAIYLGF